MMTYWLLILVVANQLGKGFANCQYEVFKKCHHVAGQNYRVDHASGVTDTKEEHCKSLQILIICLQNHTKCSGDFLDEFRFVIYGAAIISKKISCPEMKYDELKNMIQGVKTRMGVPDLEPLPVNDCAKAVFRDCYLIKFAQNMVTTPDICRNVDSMASCFEKESRSCNSALLEAYIEVLEKHAEHVTHIAEENKTDIKLCSF